MAALEASSGTNHSLVVSILTGIIIGLRLVIFRNILAFWLVLSWNLFLFLLCLCLCFSFCWSFNLGSSFRNWFCFLQFVIVDQVSLRFRLADLAGRGDALRLGSLLLDRLLADSGCSLGLWCLGLLRGLVLRRLLPGGRLLLLDLLGFHAFHRGRDGSLTLSIALIHAVDRNRTSTRLIQILAVLSSEHGAVLIAIGLKDLIVRCREGTLRCALEGGARGVAIAV